MRQRLLWLTLVLCVTIGALPAVGETPAGAALPGLSSLVPAGDQCTLPADGQAPVGDALPLLAAPAPDGGCFNFCCTSSSQCVDRCGDAAACTGSSFCKRCILL
jgi:hypothetical protein